MPFATACSVPDSSLHNPKRNSPPFAPAAVFVLDSFQPGNSFLHFRASRIALHSIQCAKHRPSSIDVIHSPAAEPAAVFLLRAQEIIDAARDHGIARRNLSKLAQHGKTAGRDIRRRRIEQGTVIGERDIIQIIIVIIGIEGAPAAVGALQAFDRRVRAFALRSLVIWPMAGRARATLSKLQAKIMGPRRRSGVFPRPVDLPRRPH